MGKGPDRKARVSFFPRSKLRIVQMKITTRGPLSPPEMDPPGFSAIFDYLQMHQAIPRILKQDFPDGSRQLSILVQLDTSYTENVHKQVSRLNRKYCSGKGCSTLTSKVVPNDELPIFNAPGIAPLLPSSY